MRYYTLSLLLLIIASLANCKKNTVSPSPLASLNVVNATVNLSPVKVNFTDLKGLYSSITTTVAYGTNMIYPVNAGVTVPVTIVPLDTTNIVFSGSFNFEKGGIYSLYLAGQSTAVDTIFVNESTPKYTDSIYSVQFINLSYNSTPITITLSTSPTVAQFSGLAYKQASAFKIFSAAASTATDTFQIRNAATNSILASYPIVKPRFFSCTLAWKGMTGATGTNAPGIMRVNHY